MTGGLDRLAVHSQLAAAIDLVVHVVRDVRGERRVACLGVLERAADGTVAVTEALRSAAGEQAARGLTGPGWARLCDRLGREP